MFGQSNGKMKPSMDNCCPRDRNAYNIEAITCPLVHRSMVKMGFIDLIRNMSPTQWEERQAEEAMSYLQVIVEEQNG